MINYLKNLDEKTIRSLKIICSYVAIILIIIFIWNVDLKDELLSPNELLFLLFIRIISIVFVFFIGKDLIKSKYILPFKEWDRKYRDNFKENYLYIYFDKRETKKINQIKETYRSGSYYKNLDGSYQKIIKFVTISTTNNNKPTEMIKVFYKVLTPDEYIVDKEKNKIVSTPSIGQQVILKGDNNGVIANRQSNSSNVVHNNIVHKNDISKLTEFMKESSKLTRLELKHIQSVLQSLNQNEFIEQDDCDDALNILEKIKKYANDNATIINIVTNIISHLVRL